MSQGQLFIVAGIMELVTFDPMLFVHLMFCNLFVLQGLAPRLQSHQECP